MNINIKTPILAALTLVTTESAKALNNSTLTTPVPKTEVVDNKTNSTEQHSQYFLQANRNQSVLADTARQSLNQIATPARFAALFGANLTVGTDISHLIHSPLLGGQSVIQLDNVDVHVQEREGRNIISNLTAPADSTAISSLTAPLDSFALAKGQLEQMLEENFSVLKDLRIKNPEFHFHNSILKVAQKILSMKQEGKVADVGISYYADHNPDATIINRVTGDLLRDRDISNNLSHKNFIVNIHVRFTVKELDGNENYINIHQYKSMNGYLLYEDNYENGGWTDCDGLSGDYKEFNTSASISELYNTYRKYDNGPF